MDVVSEADEQVKQSKDGSKHVTDEKISTIIHFVTGLAALLGSVMLIVEASAAGKPWHIVSFSVYGICLVFMFTASCLHHGIDGTERTNSVLRSLDYGAIFLMIAGSLTPICLVIARGTLGWSLFGVVWAISITGLVLRLVFPKLPKFVTSTMYITLGWMSAVAAWPVYQAAGWPAVSFMAVGGLCYSLGLVMFTREKPNPIPGTFGFHEIWHLWVSAGAVCHFLLVYLFVLPY
jgi:hemolysin III